MTLYQWWSRFIGIEKKEEALVARPRLVKLLAGEISLSGYTPEVADKLVEHIKSFYEAPKADLTVSGLQISTPSTVKPFLQEITKENLTHVALGNRFEKSQDKFIIDTIKYNPLTKEALVVASEDAGYSKAQATIAYKVKALKEGLV